MMIPYGTKSLFTGSSGSQSRMNIDHKTAYAVNCYREGKFREAESIFKESIFKRILEQTPHNVVLHFMSLINYRLQYYNTTIEYLHRSLQYD
jgi:hypothetical protein